MRFIGATPFSPSAGPVLKTKEFHAIPCLNERDDWIRALADIVLTQLMGWTDAATHEALEHSRLRALSLGAKN